MARRRHEPSSAEIWDELVATVVCKGDRAKQDALELAAAALRFAGQRDLAASILTPAPMKEAA